MSPWRAGGRRLLSSLRFRMIAALAGLAVIPLVIATTLLFRVVRADMERRAGEALAMDARFLATEVEAELESGAGRGAIAERLRHFKTDSPTVGILLAEGSVVASSRPGGEVLPKTLVTGAQWFPFRAGEAYYGAAAEVRGAGGYKVLVVTPRRAALADFDTLLRYTVLICVSLAAALLAIAWRLTGNLLKPIALMRNGAEIISKINLSHRIEVDTGDELELLAGEFNAMAQALQNAYGELEGRVEKAVGDLARERNRLAAILSTMVEGVVVANDRGETVLLNPAGRAALLEGPGSGVGLPLASLLRGERFDFYLKRLLDARRAGRDRVEEVIFKPASGKILRGAATTFTDHTGRIAFLMVFRDVTEEAASEERALNLLASMPSMLKGPLASLQAATEILSRREDLDRDRRARFLKALSEDAAKVGEAIREAESKSPEVRYLLWPIVSADPVELVREALADTPSSPATLAETPAAPVRVAVEPFGYLCLLKAPLLWLAPHAAGSNPIEVRVEAEEETVTVTYRLAKAPRMDGAELEAKNVSPPGEPTVTVREMAAINRAGLWLRRDPRGLEVRLAAPLARRAAEERPEGYAPTGSGFYDFDLLHAKQRAGEEALFATPLDELDFAVLDTEATGLDPQGGDRLLSLSAVRVRGRKLLEGDRFDTLVDPGLPIPPEATRIHGITDLAVAGAPSPGEALTRFLAWAGDAVLVCHDAEFDTQLLAAEAARAGVPLVRRPTLDTLLLSRALHPGTQGHTLEALTARLGVELGARHTSLGDALSCARIFVALLPLLEGRGVRTLSQALSPTLPDGA